MTKSFLNATGQDLGAPFLSFRFQGRHGLDWNPGRAASGWGGAPGLVAYVPQCCPWAQGAEGEDAWPSSPGQTEDDFSPVKHLHIPSSPSCVRARVSKQGVQSLWGLGGCPRLPRTSSAQVPLRTFPRWTPPCTPADRAGTETCPTLTSEVWSPDSLAGRAVPLLQTAACTHWKTRQKAPRPLSCLRELRGGCGPEHSRACGLLSPGSGNGSCDHVAPESTRNRNGTAQGLQLRCRPGGRAPLKGGILPWPACPVG